MIHKKILQITRLSFYLFLHSYLIILIFFSFFFFRFSEICSLFPFSNEQVRVLLFRECDWTGRRLLFDSSAVEKVNVTTRTQSLNTNKANGNNATDNKDTQSQSFIEICNGYGYVYNHPASDSNNIGEMVFGSVAMSFKGTSLKVELHLTIL